MKSFQIQVTMWNLTEGNWIQKNEFLQIVR